jgi:hypothetical protein
LAAGDQKHERKAFMESESGFEALVYEEEEGRKVLG